MECNYSTLLKILENVFKSYDLTAIHMLNSVMHL